MKNPRDVSIFFAIGLGFMLFFKLVVMGEFKFIREIPRVKAQRTVIDERYLESSEALDAILNRSEELPHIQEPVDEPKIAFGPFKPIKPDAVSTPPQNPQVVIIIDDLGMSRRSSYDTIDLPGPLTLAFLPYAPQLDSITKDASSKGHELLIHVPMEPINKKLDPGPLSLFERMTPENFDLTMSKILESFDGYVGINNHMGSRLTQNPDFMNKIMQALAARDLFFVDSKTISTSVAGTMAAQNGLRYAARDVFLDHEPTPEFVMDSLKRLEQTARRKGYAIAIGHPKDVTINALREWIPTLAEKNIDLVPVSKVVRVDKPPRQPKPVEAIEAAAGD